MRWKNPAVKAWMMEIGMLSAVNLSADVKGSEEGRLFRIDLCVW